MNDNLNVNKSQAETLYRVLREHLSQSADSQQLIAAFESNPDREGAALAAYLRQTLPKDEALANQIAAALGDDIRLATIVTGGQVDQIINIARLGFLSLTVKRYFYVFRTVRQVIAFLLIMIAVGSAIAFGFWLSKQPARMVGDFNIAVAEFDEVSSSDHPNLASIISQMLFDYLDSTYQTGEFRITIQVEHDKIGVIHSPVEAADLAKRVNANLVIYGTVSVLGGSASITPKFWVSDTLKNDASEMLGAGEHQLEYDFKFNGSEVMDIVSGINTMLKQRANILVEFTQALVYRQIKDYPTALNVVNQAINEAKSYGDFKGKETLYLIAADIARLNKDLIASRQFVSESLRINPKYARAYIALGNVFYEQRDFVQAYQNYDHAIKLKDDQPYGAHIVEKANLGLGNIFSYQFQSQPTNSALAERALTYFSNVTDAYQQSTDNTDKTSIAGLAALAYYGQGVIYQIQSEKDKARDALEHVLNISDDPILRQRAQDRLNQLGSN